ncbi:class I SAM-dependent methyltransferase [Nocardia amamiensis]|uniref:class I SAM-dependent methyltransferase n=1 Tax=Nocardia amamiensis TaxID=404578 RepID=UPI00082BDEE0|nr:class I SAM-dependent methyltransferase [Nocardia amamiensis]
MTAAPTVTSEYSTLTPLQIRLATHRDHSLYPDNPVVTVLGALALTGAEDIADIGCGDGRFLAHLATSGHAGRIVGADNSPAMVAAAAAITGVDAYRCDAAALPFLADTFDIVTARHMLYHLPDPHAALTEFARITRPGGRVAVTVNHPGTAAHTREIIEHRARQHGIEPAPELVNTVNSTTLPDIMTRVFGAVDIARFDNALVFTEPTPLIRFATSLFAFCGITEDHPARDEIAAVVAADITDWFATRPGQQFRDPKGYILATATI